MYLFVCVCGVFKFKIQFNVILKRRPIYGFLINKIAIGTLLRFFKKKISLMKSAFVNRSRFLKRKLFVCVQSCQVLLCFGLVRIDATGLLEFKPIVHSVIMMKCILYYRVSIYHGSQSSSHRQPLAYSKFLPSTVKSQLSWSFLMTFRRDG